MRRVILVLVGVAIGLVIGYGVIQMIQQGGPVTFHGTVLEPSIPAPDVTLTAVTGDVQLSDFRDEIVLIYFGYTFCPDVCPATLTDLAKVQRIVDDDGGQMQVVMITIDPERDSPQMLAEYVAHFHPDFMGLSGTPEQISVAAGAYGIYYAAQPSDSDDAYLMDHTSSVMLLDGAGDTRVLYGFGTPAADILADVRALLR